MDAVEQASQCGFVNQMGTPTGFEPVSADLESAVLNHFTMGPYNANLGLPPWRTLANWRNWDRFYVSGPTSLTLPSYIAFATKQHTRASPQSNIPVPRRGLLRNYASIFGRSVVVE